MNIYLASGFHRRTNLRALTTDLIANGHSVTSSWVWLNERPARETEEWPEFAKKIAGQNLIDLIKSDTLVIDTNGISDNNHGGVHTELGWFIAKDLPIYLIGDNLQNTFMTLPSIIRVEDYYELLLKL